MERAVAKRASRGYSRVSTRKPVRTGLDVIAQDRWRLLRRLSVGLVCNPTSVDQQLRHAADLLAAASGVRLTALFGPEHGVRGEAQYMVPIGDERDARTGVPVYSLYGATRRSLSPTASQLEGLDALVFDIQDVGARYYTYQATMMLCMEAAAAAGIKFIVLDRPNPIGGDKVEGPRLQPGFESFCGLHDIAPRHGMTVGELAELYRVERGLDLDLTVVECRDWRRGMHQRETATPWVFPSPNMPTPETALVYPGMCLLEGTNLSEGRGTTKPFEVFGAPWLDGFELAESLNAARLPGVKFRPVTFVPSFDKHRGVQCHGAELFVTDRGLFEPFRTAVACVVHARIAAPSPFAWRTEAYEFVEGIPAFDLLCGSDRERRAIEHGVALRQIETPWGPEERSFERRRQRYLRYPG